MHAVTEAMKSVRPNARRAVLLLTITIASLLNGTAFGRGVRCTAPGIQGFDREADQAKRYVGFSETSDLGAAKFYLTVQGDFLYVHTNYKELGADYVTKLSSDESMDLETVVANIGGRFEGADLALRSASFIVTDDLLRSRTWTERLDFSEVGSLAVVKDGEARGARTFRATGEEPRWVLEYGRGVFIDAAHDGSAALVDALRRQAFTSGDMRLVSLSLNSATVERVGRTPNAVTFEGTSVDALRAELQRHAGKVLFVLGHVEDGMFVTRNAANKEVFRIGVPELETLAQECCAIRLFAVGCHSAEIVPRGMLDTFNTLRALDRYEQALQATTMLGFLETFATGDPRLSLVVDSALVQEEVTAGVQPQVKGEVRVIASSSPVAGDSPIRGVEVARIWYAAPPPPSPSPTTTDTSAVGFSDTTAPADEESNTTVENSIGYGCGIAIIALLLIAVTAWVRRARTGTR